MPNQKELIEILNDKDPHEEQRRDIMHVVLLPFEPGVPIGVRLTGMYGTDVKFVPRSAIPESFRDKIELGEMYLVSGNLMTKYAKDLCFTEFGVAPAPDPNDGLG